MTDTKNKKPFKLIFIVVLVLTVTSLVIAVTLAMNEINSPRIQSLFETCSTCWKMGFGALIGLVGGQNTNLSH